MVQYWCRKNNMSSFLTRINYSSVNEDSASELTALQLGSNDRCLCITGSGARPLDLLTQPLGEIVSMDMNPCQNYLLELKIAAIRSLSYDGFCAFIGLTPSANRLTLYLQFCKLLTSDARHYWDRHQRSIEKGILYQGSWERYFKILATYLSLTRESLLLRLFSSESVHEQAEIWDSQWNNVHWRTFLRLVSSRWCWKYILQDPGFYRYVEKDFSIADYIAARLNVNAHTIHFQKSPFTNILFLGKLHPNSDLPNHLQENHYQQLQKNIDRLSIISAPLGTLSDQKGIGCFHAFSISDVSSYTDQDAYEQIWRAMNAVSENGARICERQFLVKRDIPDICVKLFTRDVVLESQLTERDSSIFYTFVCATKK